MVCKNIHLIELSDENLMEIGGFTREMDLLICHLKRFRKDKV